MICVSDTEIQIVLDILRQVVPDCDVLVFGSRYKWTPKEYSDLDLAVVSNGKLDKRVIFALKEAFEESELPYSVDVVDYHQCSDTFRKIIDSGNEKIFNGKQKNMKHLNLKSEWKSVRVGDICKINMGQSPKSEFYNIDKRGLPFLQGNRTFGDKYPTFDTYTTSTTKIAEAGDVIMSVRAPVGDINITPIKMCLGRGVCSLRHKQGEQEFLYYLMRYYSKKLINRESGTVFGAVNRNDIAKLEVSIPSLLIQRRIAEILGSLDDKIANNTKINYNLEQLAQAIFKSWFVDFEPFGGKMPKNWRKGMIRDIAVEIVCGKTPSTKIHEYFGNDVPFITIPDMHDRTYVTSTERLLSNTGATSQCNKTVPPNSICVSCIATAGLVVLTSVNSQTNQQINTIVCKNNISPFYVYLIMLGMSEHIKMLGSSGSATNNLNKGQFEKIELLIPENNVIEEFSFIVEPLFEKIKQNQYESEYLTTIRDALLPRLMSGELPVADRGVK